VKSSTSFKYETEECHPLVLLERFCGCSRKPPLQKRFVLSGGRFISIYLSLLQLLRSLFKQIEVLVTNVTILLYDATKYTLLHSGYANQIIPYASLKIAIECTMFLNKRKLNKMNLKVPVTHKILNSVGD
jgi:hypothetical protein